MVAVVIACGFSPDAMAASISYTSATDRFSSSHVTVTGDPGESSRLTVTPDDAARVVVFEDSHNRLRAGAGCRQEADRIVQCPHAETDLRLHDGDDGVVATTASYMKLYAFLGDGDDAALVASGWVRGGAGNDRLAAAPARDGAFMSGDEGADLLTGSASDDSLEGGRGDDLISGGDGDDQLRGGPGSDRLLGEEGDDLLGASEGLNPVLDLAAPVVVPAAPEPPDDLVDGGSGQDVALYDRSAAPVVVDLADPAPDGAPHEHDQLQSIEGASGSGLDDRLLGDGRPNRFWSGKGHDIVDGRGGDDNIDTGGAPDLLIGGAGADSLRGPPGTTYQAGDGDDRIARPSQHVGGEQPSPIFGCGDGTDTVIGARADDRIPASCERIGFQLRRDRLTTTPRPRRDRRGIAVPIACPPQTPDGCRVHVQLLRGQVVIARETAALAQGRRSIVRLRGRAGHRVRIVVRWARLPDVRVTYGSAPLR